MVNENNGADRIMVSHISKLFMEVKFSIATSSISDYNYENANIKRGESSLKESECCFAPPLGGVCAA